ncbi:MAG: hypothetical protein ACPLRR_01320, partial [Candidatus Saccharicenans sp.]
SFLSLGPGKSILSLAKNWGMSIVSPISLSPISHGNPDQARISKTVDVFLRKIPCDFKCE